MYCFRSTSMRSLFAILVLTFVVAVGAGAQPGPICDPILNPCPDISAFFPSAPCSCPTGDCPAIPWQSFTISNAQYASSTDSGICIKGRPFKARLNFRYRFCNGVLELCSSSHPYFLSDGTRTLCVGSGICAMDYRTELAYALEMMIRQGVISIGTCPDYFAVKWYICAKCSPLESCTSTSRCYMWINVCNTGEVRYCSYCPPDIPGALNRRLGFELVGIYGTESCQPTGGNCTPSCQALYDILKCFDGYPGP